MTAVLVLVTGVLALLSGGLLGHAVGQRRGRVAGRAEMPARVRAVVQAHEVAVTRLTDERDRYAAAAESHEVKRGPKPQPKRSTREFAWSFVETLEKLPARLEELSSEGEDPYVNVQLYCDGSAIRAWQRAVAAANWRTNNGSGNLIESGELALATSHPKRSRRGLPPSAS